MCGIYAAVSQTPIEPICGDLKTLLLRRGPDHIGSHTSVIKDGDTQLHITLVSTVLALRGKRTTAQPLVDQDSQSVLCWNGEAWKIDGVPVEAGAEGNDGVTVLSRLVAASPRGREAVLDTLRAIEGPFAFVFFDAPSRTLYFGRDRLGRRSLLVRQGSSFQLCSVADAASPGWLEVEADGCYTLSLAPSGFFPVAKPVRNDWDRNAHLVSALGIFNCTTPHGPKDERDGRKAVEQLKSHLLQSLQYRVLGIPVPPGADRSQARVAVLFSGGLDCSVLARLMDELLPEDQQIDLLNVAFENPRIAAQHKNLGVAELCEQCPDRITGRRSFAELIKTRPARRWNFVAMRVNIPYTDTIAHRPVIVGLIAPHNTEMDLSIACALYFAARGSGLAQTAAEAETTQYATTARVLVSGLGADELFGGYSRHGIAFQQRGYQGLIEELKLDVGRLGKRNMGRDDRAMSHWGREVRFPFLDENLVKWAIETPVWQKCDFGDDGGEQEFEPAKRVLRLLARELGLVTVASEKKRAIQFGARTAKMESGRTKGTTLIDMP